MLLETVATFADLQINTAAVIPLLKFFICLFNMCVSVLSPVISHVPHACLPGTHEVRKASDSLEVQLRIVVITMWAPGTEPRSSTKATSDLNYFCSPVFSKGKI